MNMKILGNREEIVTEVKEQMSIWADKFKINLEFLAAADEDCLCISMVELGKTVFVEEKKDKFLEPEIDDYDYAISLLEEAKKMIAFKHQEHLSKIFEEKLANQ